MKRTLLIALFALGLLAPITRRASAQAFEGTITYSLTIPQMDEDKHEMLMNIKGQQIETEMDMGPQGGMKAWIDLEAKKMYVYMAAMGGGMTMDLPNEKTAVSNKDTVSNALVATGQKAMIAGHHAEEYTMKTKDGDVSLWMTNDLPKDIQNAIRHASKLNRQQDPKMARSMKAMAEKGLVPIKTTMKSAGEVVMSSELVKVESKKLDDKIFTRPAGVQFNPMPPGMMGGGGTD